MKFLVDTYRKTGTLHHAYLIEGRSREIVPELVEFFETKVKIKTAGNPDFWHGTFETIGIDEGRHIKERQSFTAFSEGIKVFIVSAEGITHEAQNALLKVFEEPTPHTHFFLILPSAESLLPTFLSRLLHYVFESKEKEDDSLAAQFLSLRPAERINLLKPIIEDKNKARAISFLTGLEKALRNLKTGMTVKDAALFEEIILCRSYLHDRSPSVKIILEYLSLVIPTAS
ncbi:MAG: hypothetical protein U1D31_00725 [Patescibacteria group bacterium]|nr:hypothetical protein [bacterium]MDZ4240646.1 hypothetical protein [Patescibacteria group bacterium]